MEGNQNDWLTQAEIPSSPESVANVVKEPAKNQKKKDNDDDDDDANVVGCWFTQAEPPSSPESDSDAAFKKPTKSKRKVNDQVDVGPDNEDEEEADKENENENILGDARNTTTQMMLTEEEEDGNKFSDSRIRKHMPSFSYHLNADDDDSSNGSSSSDDFDDANDESSASSEESVTLTLTERRLRNEARNKQFMAQLNHKYKSDDVHHDTAELEERQQLDHEDGESDNNPSGAPRGMLFKTNFNRRDTLECHNNKQGASPMTTPHPGDELDRLNKDYPCRESQIYLLTSLIGTSIAQGLLRRNQGSSSSNAPYVPAPIFVTGPGGTGKTSVVQDVIKSLQTNQRFDTRVASAYINCGILEPSSIERLVSSAYSQLDPSDQQNPIQAQRKKRHRKRRRSSNLPLAAERTGQEPRNIPLPDPGGVARNDATGSVPTAQAHRNRQGGRDKEPVAGAVGLKSVDLEMAPELNSSKSLMDASWTMHSVVGSFGRALQPICGRECNNCAAILVLDHADRLLSLSMKKMTNERTNFLSEILILPKAMELNLTVIIISNNYCLSSSRLNSLVAAGKSVATLSNGVQPYTIQFPAYKEATALKTILSVPRVLQHVVGDEEGLLSPSPNPRNEFRRKIVETYLGALVQSLLSSTRDLRDFVRLGRSLWPVYVQPLLSSNIEGTMGMARTSCLARKPRSSTPLQDDLSSSDLESELLAFLDNRFLAIIGKSLAMGLYSLSMDSPVVPKAGTTFDMGLDDPRQLSATKMPYLRACLLLAAFICQNNKADKDKRVFSIQGNGKKRGRHQPMETTDDIAFISRIGALQQLRVARPRPFPLERMLSIFVTLVSLNPPTTPTLIGNGEDLLPSLGSTHLNGNLAQLCDLGYLHQVSNTIGSIKSEVVALSGSKYWCSLSRDDAMSIATSFDIPLNNYLM